MAVGAMVGAAAMLAAAPAHARGRDLSASLTTTGSITVTWHGNHSRGCAAAGLCGYRGSTSAEPYDGQLYVSVGRGGRLDAYGDLEPQSATLTRVQRREASGAVDTCVDASPAEDFELTVRRGARGSARVGLAGDAVTAGRCAGPDLATALLKIPERSVSVARLRRGSTTIDLTARVPFRSGHFSGRIVSTLRLHVGSVRSQPGVEVGIPRHPPPGRRLARVAELHAIYRVTSFAGRFAVAFRGLGEPACNGVDACGVSGAADWAIRSSGGILVIDASALVRPSDRGLRGLRAALLRKGGGGYFDGFADLEHEVGTTTARLDRRGGASCKDSKRTLPPFLYVSRGRSGLRFLLGSPVVFPMGPDPLRAGCPGPTRSAVVGERAVASGRMPLAAIGRRRIELPLAAGGKFDDGAYGGTWSSHFTLAFERVKSRLTYRLRRVAR
jgi:hypothetical protein